MRSLYRMVQWKTEKKKVQVSVILHCSENRLRWWQSLCSARGCRAGSSSLGPLQAVWQVHAVCLPLALCCEPVTGGPTLFLCCYNDEQRESPPVLGLEYTSWLIVVLTGSSAFQPKITSREALLHAFAFHEGIPKYTVLWQYPCPGSPCERYLRQSHSYLGYRMPCQGIDWMRQPPCELYQMALQMFFLGNSHHQSDFGDTTWVCPQSFGLNSTKILHKRVKQLQVGKITVTFASYNLKT